MMWCDMLIAYHTAATLRQKERSHHHLAAPTMGFKLHIV